VGALVHSVECQLGIGGRYPHRRQLRLLKPRRDAAARSLVHGRRHRLPRGGLDQQLVEHPILGSTRFGRITVQSTLSSVLQTIVIHLSSGVYAQQLINATLETMAYYTTMQAEGLPVPRFVILLGLDNGPVTPTTAMDEEIAFLASYAQVHEQQQTPSLNLLHNSTDLLSFHRSMH